ncbi:spore coat protein [Compostibacillus humi]|uniref:Spore coat protein n=1 Tax=Compostibacillus humi TaxID=1245525 RepID=A0A8J2TNL8_9BACI|nr:glycosyltransferase family protein [Compostibacillus humi]GFZ77934.1 spore coat protein [Compostibacillus humi]
MKVVAIIQARMGSTRLPGKVLKKVLGKTLLEYQLERVQKSKRIDQVVIATTRLTRDDPIIEICQLLAVDYYRGSEMDVLSRYYEAALHYQADVVVRLTSDCPVIDPQVIDTVIDEYLIQRPKFDYVSNTLERTYPRGMDTEVFSFQALEFSHQRAAESPFREHVTPFIYTNSNMFQCKSVCYEKDVSDHRWTVDTIEDFRLISKIIEHLYPQNKDFTLEDMLHLLEENRDWKKINEHIEQKEIGR